MDIRLVSHASVIISCSDVKIWTDPWLSGRAFNDSWALLPEADFEERFYAEIDYLWISHEHPDHFHIPTLKALPSEFKDRVTVLFQKNNSSKVIDALRRLGFKNFLLLPHRKRIALTSDTSVYCCQVGGMDSSLAVMNSGETILNINDCEVNTRDCRRFLRDLGKIDVILNQFSAAGYGGYDDRETHLRGLCRQILENVSNNHKDLSANVTIPFASFMYFCTTDNCYMNHYINTPRQVADLMSEREQQSVVLYPGDTYRVNADHDSSASLSKYDEAYSELDSLQFDPPEMIPIEEIKKSFHARTGHLKKKYPGMVLRMLKPAIVEIPDLQVTVRISIADNAFDIVSDSPDVAIHSQPLKFMFDWPWGLQTLGVSARCNLKKNDRNWKRYRILFALDNAELYLMPRLFFTLTNLRWMFARAPGGVNQLRYKLERMLPAK